MYNNFISVIYILNIVWQSLFSLVTPILLGFGISWLSVTYLSFPSWSYAIFITLGTLAGFYNMIKFILSAMASYERLEKSRKARNFNDKSGNNNE